MGRKVFDVIISYLVGAYAATFLYSIVLHHYGPSHGGFIFFVPYLDLLLLAPAFPFLLAHELIYRFEQLLPDIRHDSILALGIFVTSAVVSFIVIRRRRQLPATKA